MIVDTSAVIAILRAEPEAERFSALIEQDPAPKMSVANYVEAGVVMDAPKNAVISRRLDAFVRAAEIELRPVSMEQAKLAREAYRDFGRGSGHPARLNFGDCFAYALAKEAGESLLFKGLGFIETDIDPADSTA
jgi:ribonuclease VapC